MVEQSRYLLESNGILASPAIKHGKSLSDETVKIVTNFYGSDEVSRLMPGKKDFVSVKGIEKRVHIQKRLILSNLKELYKCFKEENARVKIGFSKFASLRPKNCVLAGASGTHTVCVCTLHQNPILMLEACKTNFGKTNSAELFSDYHSLLNKIICTDPSNKCYFNECSNCPGVEKLKQQLKTIFDSCCVEQVIFKQWVSTDRCTLETLIKSGDEFIDALLQALTNLLRHSYIAKQQSKYFKDVKEKLSPGHFIIICDFAQNYSFVIQDEIQGYHWNNEQATLHPFVYYYKDETGDLKSGSYVAISDCRKHDTVLFYLFQKEFIKFLKNKHNNIVKAIYFTDGCGGQYKNFKNFLNITYHEEDFGIPAEWNFFATSHGKGACDGIGGTVKRLAARASLQRPYNDQITTPHELYTWSKANLPNINFEFFPNENYQSMDQELNKRFDQAKTVAGTLQIHSVIPIEKGIISTKFFSYDTKSTQRKFLKRIPKIKIEIKPPKRLQRCSQRNKLNKAK